ncbi:unnamed protein product [Haemonchus placei]|uniref:MARVEL domain-containing protein n=1 Tax=Haemonchus placei TaxID=6290 RepID=A0A0N4X609_HAEPC|nr:unnamed protein product [Haemonchus placei]
MAQEKNNFTQTCILVCSLILIVIAFALSAAGLFSPSWQVVDIREFRAEHHVSGASTQTGLIDAIILYSLPLYTVFGCINLCMNLFLIMFSFLCSAWHKAVLGCLIVSLLFASLALCCGLCAPCNGGCAVIFSIFVFLALFMAVIGDGIFFFAAHRVDNRFVQGLVGTYEQQIGVAFYLHGAGTLVLMFGFLVAVIASYQILRKSELSNSLPLRELAPLYGSRMRETFA